MDIRTAQQRAWDNVVAKGFGQDDIPRELCLLHGELAEVYDAWRHGRDDLDEELADVAIYLMSLATMTGVDLADAIERKMTKNERRRYEPDPRSGALVRVDDGE